MSKIVKCTQCFCDVAKIKLIEFKKQFYIFCADCLGKNKISPKEKEVKNEVINE